MLFTFKKNFLCIICNSKKDLHSYDMLNTSDTITLSFAVQRRGEVGISSRVLATDYRPRC